MIDEYKNFVNKGENLLKREKLFFILSQQT